MLSTTLSMTFCSRILKLEPFLQATQSAFRASSLQCSKAFSTNVSNVKNSSPLQLLTQIDVFEHDWGSQAAIPDVRAPSQNSLPKIADRLHPLMVYKAQYPPEVWTAISDLCKGKRFPDVVDVNCTGGRSAIELAKRGFRVMGIESSATMLAQTQVRARGAGVELQLLGAERERQLLQDGCADLFTVMHGFHLLDVSGALAEAHRILRPGGNLVAAWNDRCIDVPFMEELEDIMEAYNPHYNRAQKQRDPEVWAPILTQGDLFHLHHYSTHSHTLHMPSFKEFVTLVSHLHALKDLMADNDAMRKSLQADLRKLVLKHTASLDHIPVSMETELYMLAKK